MMSGIGIIGMLILGLFIGMIVFALRARGSGGLTDSGPPPASGMTLSCPHCGRETLADKHNCEHCGAEL